MGRPVIVTGETVHGVWCPPCNAPVRVRVPLHFGSIAAPVAAHLEVCASCGHRYIPALPVVELVPQRYPWWRRARPVTGLLWAVNRRLAARDGRQAQACAYEACRRPGWWTCCWFAQVEFGTVRWVFCGRRHRAKWIANRMGG